MNASGLEFERTCSNLPDSIQNDLACLLKEKPIYERDNLIYKLCTDNNNKSILFLCNLKDKNIDSLKSISTFGLFGELYMDTSIRNFLSMHCSVKLSCTGYPIEIVKIHAGKEKRTGRGTLCIKFLEDELIPEVNKILLNQSNGSSVSYIFGISSDLSDDTNMFARAKFYSKNGFTLSFSHFYKYLNNKRLM